MYDLRVTYKNSTALNLADTLIRSEGFREVEETLNCLSGLKREQKEHMGSMEINQFLSSEETINMY